MKHAPKRDYTLPVEGEPDITKGYHMGLAYRIIRHPAMGHLCGYVKLPINHPWLKPARALKWEHKWFSGRYQCVPKGYDIKAMRYLPVHGGITFFGRLSRGRGHWIGFDCAHCDDLVPGMQRIMPELRADWTVYRDLAFVSRNCKELAEAVAAAK